MMDDGGADDVFICPSPPTSCSVPPLPAEGNSGEMADNSCMTLSKEAADATEADANPGGLDWHQAGKQLLPARNEADEVTTRTEQHSKEFPNRYSPSNLKDSTSSYQEQTSPDGSTFIMESSDKAGKYQDDPSGDEDSNEEPAEIIFLSDDEESFEEEDVEEEKCPQQMLSNVKETPICQDQEENESKHEDVCVLSERMKDAHNPLFTAEVTKDDKEQVDAKALDFTLKQSDEVRRESGSAGTKEAELSTTKDCDKMMAMDESRRIFTDIQQGEYLLQRLQMVQLRHEEIPDKPQQIVKTVASQELVDLENGKIRKGSVSEEDEEQSDEFKNKTSDHLMEGIDKSSSKVPDKAEETLFATLRQSEHKEITRTQGSDSEEHQSDDLIPLDLPVSPQKTSCGEIPFASAGHRFSAAETSMEKHFHEAAQGKPNLQRAGGVFNLADDPDVLEIPFKTNVSLESLLTKACTSQPTQWQFSERKMQKEISREIQRELVLVNQGKIPGEYSKGEARQLKETKLLFEAFQQCNTHSPTKQSKGLAAVPKDQVYPSVLERTRSLEMLSLKSCPVSRTHSLRLFNPASSDGSENFRAKSPTGASRDKIRVSPYSKQEKYQGLHRSMDSINIETSKSAVEAMSSTMKANKSQGSPVLKQNPFFKLRPALALQPDVAKDIREAREREEELRQQRSHLYGESKRNPTDEEKSLCAQTHKSDYRQQGWGKLERVWPPPKKDQKQSQQDPQVHKAAGQKTQLWQRWESGLINGQTSKEKK